MSFELNEQMVDSLAKQHRWAATGVSDYPPRDPLVGQSRFFKRFQTFLHTVDHDDDRFAHVFAVEAEWGRGKSRLGHELVAQINDCSRGWLSATNKANCTISSCLIATRKTNTWRSTFATRKWHQIIKTRITGLLLVYIRRYYHWPPKPLMDRFKVKLPNKPMNA